MRLVMFHQSTDSQGECREKKQCNKQIAKMNSRKAIGENPSIFFYAFWL